MGTIYYGVCHDCKQFIDLNKFYSWSAYKLGGYADIDKEDLSEYGKPWIYRSLRLHYFMFKHQGHRVGVYNEHEIDLYHELGIGMFEEIFPWPSSGDMQTDEIDWTDPKAGRLIIKTQWGDIFIDNRGDDINCFRFVNGERIETILLKK